MYQLAQAAALGHTPRRSFAMKLGSFVLMNGEKGGAAVRAFVRYGIVEQYGLLSFSLIRGKSCYTSCYCIRQLTPSASYLPTIFGCGIFLADWMEYNQAEVKVDRYQNISQWGPP